MPPNEVVVVISFELALGEIRGMINLCVPYNALERISNRLSANTWMSYTRREATSESMAQIGRNLRGASVRLRVQLAKTRITTAELLSLRIGDIITTAKDIRQPMLVFVEDVPKILGQTGYLQGP